MTDMERPRQDGDGVLTFVSLDGVIVTHTDSLAPGKYWTMALWTWRSLPFAD